MNQTMRSTNSYHWLLLTGLLVLECASADETASYKTIDFGRFKQCPVLENDSIRVVLCPQSGGRILEYSLSGTNALFVSPADLGQDVPGSRWNKDPGGGRFDIGPELMMPRRDTLFRGEWKTDYLTPLHVRLTSQDCPDTGVRLERDFVLSPHGSALRIDQTIVNVSAKTVRYCHWSRTLANGAGVVIIPLSEPRRFPNGYVRYDSGALTMRPTDPNVRIRDGYLEILGPPLSQKLGMDSMAGWLAHQQTSGLLFIKKFATYPERAYAEVAALTIATWTPPTGETVELEPIGPTEVIPPGASAAFTENWWLLEGKLSGVDERIDLVKLAEQVAALEAVK